MFYIQLLYKTRYFVNNVIYGLNLFIVLLPNVLSSIYLEWFKEEAETPVNLSLISKIK